MIGFGYKGSLIFYNTPEITAKRKVKSLKRKSKKKDDKEATQKAVEKGGRKGELPDNMSSEEVKKKEEGNMTQHTYLEQILKPHFVPEIKRLMTEREEDILLEEDNDEVHGTQSLNNKVQAFKDQEHLQTYSNSPGSSDLSLIENV
ncbi:hypothetical protein MMC24_004940 [Lignoscripta atroalba]|nr:hypothetical protein [Lignoscripta atroalba]